MEAGDKPDTKLPPADERLQSFLVRAAPVLAVERGINLKSRVLLETLARELGLADDQFQAALRALQNGHSPEAPPDPAVLKRRAEYDTYARKQLSKLPRGVLTASLEARIAEAGTYQFQLPEAASHEVLKAAAKELSIQVVTADEATRHVAAQVAALVRDAEWVDDATQKRLHTVGIEWGLTHERINELIQSHLVAAREGKTRRQWLLYGAVAGGAALAATCLGILAWMNLGRPDAGPSAKLPGDPATPVSPGGKRPAEPPPVSSTAWWDRELTIRMAAARVSLGPVISAVDRIKSSDPAVRTKAYDELVSHPWRGKTDESRRMVLGEVLAGCLALDPDAKSADALRDKLIAVLPADAAAPATQGEAFRSYWAVDTLLKAAARETIAPERRSALLAALGAALGTTLDPSAEQLASERRAFQKLYERHYRRMILAAAEKPLEARRYYDELMDYARSVLDQNTRSGLDADFLAAVLPAASADSGWEQYIDVIRDVVRSKEPLHVLRMVELYEKTENERLRDQLEYLLLLRVDVMPSSFDVKEVARAVRTALGVSSKALARQDRPAAFVKIAEGLIAAPRAGTDNDANVLQEAANLARGNALGWALAQGELGHPVFDELLAREPAKVLAGGPAAPTPGPRDGPSRVLGPVTRLDPGQKHRLDQKILAISRYKNMAASERKIVLRYITTTADQIPDVTPEQGAVIARYLLGGNKAPQEDGEIIDIARPLMHWKSVKLGIADELAETKLTQDNLERLLHAALGREVRLADDPNWRATWRLALLAAVRDELELGGAAIVAPEATKFYDNAADALRDMYLAEARTAGVPSATYQAATTPSAGLRLLVEGAAARMASTKLRAADAELVAGMRYQLAAADYLAENDVRRTALYQRLWLRLVAAAAVRERPEMAVDVDRIVSDLGEQDARAKSATEQLRDGELARLRVWALVHGKAK